MRKWKGTKTEYRTLHYWVSRELGKPNICTHCNSTDDRKRYHWANISGEYKEDLTDWIRLCAKCHVVMDIGGSKRIKDANGIEICNRGHKMTPENTYNPPRGYSECRTCRSINRSLSLPSTVGRNVSYRKRNIYCRKGLHKLEGDNVYWQPKSGRACRACKNKRRIESYYANNTEEAKEKRRASWRKWYWKNKDQS